MLFLRYFIVFLYRGEENANALGEDVFPERPNSPNVKALDHVSDYRGSVGISECLLKS